MAITDKATANAVNTTLRWLLGHNPYNQPTPTDEQVADALATLAAAADATLKAGIREADVRKLTEGGLPQLLSGLGSFYIDGDDGYPWLTCNGCGEPVHQVEAGDGLEDLTGAAAGHACTEGGES